MPDTIEACHELIKQLLVVVDGLQRKVQELEDRLNQNSRNSHKPPSSDGLRKPAFPPKNKGKRGGQAGHQGKTLKMVEQADETIELKPAVCIACQQDLGRNVEAVMESRRQVFELPFHPVRKHVRALNRRRKHDYKPNRNITGGLLKRFVVRFFLRPGAELADALAEYRRLVLMNLEPERPGRNRERRRRLMRGTERHVHEKNYRRAQ